jgi:hypothetical protein
MIFLRLAARWATLTGNHFLALKLMEQIIMADFTAFDAAFAAATARVAADNAALAKANDALQVAQNADQATQTKVDGYTAQLASLANGN